jgi:hypothetical protein
MAVVLQQLEIMVIRATQEPPVVWGLMARLALVEMAQLREILEIPAVRVLQVALGRLVITERVQEAGMLALREIQEIFLQIRLIR